MTNYLKTVVPCVPIMQSHGERHKIALCKGHIFSVATIPFAILTSATFEHRNRLGNGIAKDYNKSYARCESKGIPK